MMDDENEERLYAELKAEDDAAGGETGWGDPVARDDDGGGSDDDYRAPSMAEAKADWQEQMRAAKEPDGDAEERIERARIDADNQLYEEQTYGQPRQRGPDPAEDPIGYIRALDRERQAERSRADYTQFMNAVDQHEQTFVALQPDYHQAAEFLEKGRKAELEQLYPDDDRQAHVVARKQGFASPAKLREAIFVNDAQTIARNALQSGKNPAKVYFDLAKSRGYQPKAASRSSGGRSSGKSSGGQSVNTIDRLSTLYSEDPEAFDREFDKMASAGKLG